MSPMENIQGGLNRGTFKARKTYRCDVEGCNNTIQKGELYVKYAESWLSTKFHPPRRECFRHHKEIKRLTKRTKNRNESDLM